jgi:hypothetical protein
MPTYRMTIVICIQHVGEVFDSPLPTVNARVIGTTFGALLPGYDGMDLIGQPDEQRQLFASSLPSTRGAGYSPPSASSHAVVAPWAWWQPQLFELEAPAAPTFVVAWGAKANMGTGFDVQ